MTRPLRTAMYPRVVYVIVPKEGGPPIHSTWSREIAMEWKKRLRLRGNFVVRKYVAAGDGREGTNADRER